MVAAAGLEPTTSGLWARRAANCSTPRYRGDINPDMVPVTGLEPVRYRYRGILSPLCLPIPPHRRISARSIIPHPLRDVKPQFQISAVTNKKESWSGVVRRWNWITRLLSRLGEVFLPSISFKFFSSVFSISARYSLYFNCSISICASSFNYLSPAIQIPRHICKYTFRFLF